MGERCPVQTSAVYVLGRASQFAAVPPPSPPSPATGNNSRDLCVPIEELSLDAVNATAVVAAAAAATPDHAVDARTLPSAAASAAAAAPTSALASVPDSPDLSPCVLSPTYSSCSLASFASSRAGPSATSVTTAASVGSSSSSVASLATISASAPTCPVLPAAATTTTTTTTHVASSSRLAGAVHVLATEAAALQSVAQLYATSPDARDGFDQAVEAIVRTQTAHPSGKLVIVGVGKSGHIGRKLVATFNSLAIPASFLHPTEALHGDLGHIREHDALLFITYSGKSHELVALLPHLDAALPLIILTGHVTADTCELVRQRNDANVRAAAAGPTILLPAPIPVEEKVSFGVAAPTASTTTALAVGDALAIVTSKELHPSTESVFRRNHPGGAIGQAFQKQASSASTASLSSLASSSSSSSSSPSPSTVRHHAVPWKDIPVVQDADCCCADVLRAGYSSTNGWVRIVVAQDAEYYVAPPSRIRALCSADLARPVHEVGRRLVVSRADFVAVAADTTLREAAATAETRAENGGGGSGDGDAVVAVMEHGEIVGVLELQDLLREA